MKLTPLSQKEILRRFRHLGWEGPIYKGDHPFMRKGDSIVKMPNPHRSDISPDLISKILRQASISREDWINAR